MHQPDLFAAARPVTQREKRQKRASAAVTPPARRSARAKAVRAVCGPPAGESEASERVGLWYVWGSGRLGDVIEVSAHTRDEATTTAAEVFGRAPELVLPAASTVKGA